MSTIVHGEGESKPRVILGLMTFGQDESKGARVTSLSEFEESLDLLKERGYGELDTARIYVGGTQESFTRLANFQKRNLSISTKSYPFAPNDHNPTELRKTLEKSLSELGVDSVDIFYLHAADRTTPFEDTLHELDTMHRQGKFARLGLSNFAAYEIAEIALLARQHGWVRPTVYQGVYNAIARGVEAEVIPACRRYGLQIVTYNPIAGGLFSGKYTAADLRQPGGPSTGRFSSVDPIMGASYRGRYFHESTFRALEIIESAVKKHALTMPEVAFRWCIHHSALSVRGVAANGNDGVILGVSSKEQLRNNLDFCEMGPLPEEVVQALDEAWAVAKANAVVYWHKSLTYEYDTEKALFGQARES